MIVDECVGKVSTGCRKGGEHNGQVGQVRTELMAGRRAGTGWVRVC